MPPATHPTPPDGAAASVEAVDPQERDHPRLSVAALVLANLWPLVGVLFFGWTVFSVLLLFWVENVIVGLLNLAKMWMARDSSRGARAAKFFLMPFFAVHYGMFTFVHGIFVITIFGAGLGTGGSIGPGTLYRLVGAAGIGPAAVAIAVSHGISFFTNYLGRGEFRTTPLATLMFQPYGRVVVLHVVILFGGFVVQALGSPMPALALLVLLKIGIDVVAHGREHTGRGGLVLLAAGAAEGSRNRRTE